MRSFAKKLIFFCCIMPLLISAKSRAPSPQSSPIKRATPEQIIKNFLFVGDFEVKEETRPNSSHEIFWRYPVTMPKITFDLDVNTDFDSKALQEDFPQTQGAGRAFEHMNTGRMLFLNKQIEEARKTWLGARARYGQSYPFHRRTDYFIAQSFLYLAYEKWLAHGKSYEDADLRQLFVNTNTFIAWAFDRKKDLPDPLLDRVTPQAFYNQAVIYYAYQRWAGVIGATNLGLEYLRKTGRSDYRRAYRRMMAEAYIHDRNYLEAVREFDMTLRQDDDIATSAAIFARIGDIYFDLNNFELAEEVYEAANRLDVESQHIKPSQYILRGESLFWSGRFEEARKTMKYALQAMSLPRSQESLDINMQALASMRIADSWLAIRDMEKAKLAYFTHIGEFKGHITEKYARIRLACLELPYYEGNNIRHTRELLAELKEMGDSLPSVAQEMAWTCETASYAQHERSQDMIERVRRFAQLYPDSGLLKSLVEPVREFQATAIEPYFQANDAYGAVQFFEKTRSFLYPKVSPELGRRLFIAYVDINQAEKAEPFMADYMAAPMDEAAWLRLAVANAEIGQSKQGDARNVWKKKNRDLNDRFLEKKMIFDKTPQVRFAIRRILETSMGDAYTAWILSIGMHWAEDDVNAGCDMVYPILQKLAASPGTNLDEKTAAGADRFIDSHLKNILRFETNCGYSLMEFEISNSPLPKRELIAKYMARDYLQLNNITVPLLWNLSEQAFSGGDREAAERMWKFLVDKGDPGMMEVRYAKLRLDKRKTELEGLWSK